jgi:hypothetical protein
VRELLRVAEHTDGWGVPAHWDSARKPRHPQATPGPTA